MGDDKIHDHHGDHHRYQDKQDDHGDHQHQNDQVDQDDVILTQGCIQHNVEMPSHHHHLSLMNQMINDHGDGDLDDFDYWSEH